MPKPKTSAKRARGKSQRSRVQKSVDRKSCRQGQKIHNQGLSHNQNQEQKQEHNQSPDQSQDQSPKSSEQRSRGNENSCLELAELVKPKTRLQKDYVSSLRQEQILNYNMVITQEDRKRRYQERHQRQSPSPKSKKVSFLP